MGDRMDNIQPGRDAVAAPLRRQPDPHRHRSTSSSAPACATPTAACARFRRDVLPALDLRTTGMEFASEMVIRAAKENLDIRQFPIEYHPRGGESKLSSFRDGWRHLRFLLVHSPTHLFIIPGARHARCSARSIALTVARAASTSFGREWDLHAMIAGALLMIVGTQVLAPRPVRARLRHATSWASSDPWFDRMRARFRLEHGLLLGGAIAARRRS